MFEKQNKKLLWRVEKCLKKKSRAKFLSWILGFPIDIIQVPSRDFCLPQPEHTWLESIAKFGVRESPVLLHFRPLQTHITTPKYNPNYAPKHSIMHDVNSTLSPFLVTLPPQKEVKVFFLLSYKCLTVSETI